MTAPATGSPVNGPRGLPRTIWALGLVSLFMDVSSELIPSLLPIYLVSVLGASALTVGGHTVTAVYNADSNFSGSTSSGVTETVAAASSSTAVSASANPAVIGANVSVEVPSIVN